MGVMGRLVDRLPWSHGVDSTEFDYVLLADLPTWQELHHRTIPWPIGYRSMLTVNPLEGRDLYVERKNVQESLNEAVQRWRGGYAPMLAMIGPDGCGRTTLLNWFESGLPIGESVTRVNGTHRIRSEQALLDWLSEVFNLAQPVSTLNEMVAALRALPPRIVILDDLQRLLLRALGSSHVVHALIAILLGTQEHFLWIVSVRESSWRMLDYQFGISRYFTHTPRLGYFTAEQLREALRLRLVVAGAHAEEAEVEAELESLLSSQRQHEFMAVSSGNMRAALFHLLIYARYDEERGRLVMQRGKKVDLSMLGKRGDLDLFTLSELIGNSGLTVAEHAEIFQREAIKSRVVLEHLKQLRLLERHEMDNGESFYQLDPVFYLPVTTMLQASHVLY